jgi:hypothetical protein
MDMFIRHGQVNSGLHIRYDSETVKGTSVCSANFIFKTWHISMSQFEK